MLEIYKKVVLQNYANFKGRARRQEFWMFTLVNAIISTVLGKGLGLISDNLSLIGGIYSLAVLVPAIAVGVRRMQDQDKEWWNILIPFYNIYLFTLEGTAGPNQYGPDSKSQSENAREIGKDLN